MKVKIKSKKENIRKGFALFNFTLLTFSFLIFSFSLLTFSLAFAGEGDDLFNAGKFEAAAKWYVSAGKNPHDLLFLGKSLEKLSDPINTAAERKCFRSGGNKGTACMNAYASELNSVYGAGSFEYAENLVFMRYTGVHYKELVEKFPKSNEVPEAAYLQLSKNLVGHPDEVLPRIKDYMKKYPGGEWGRKGNLLWARINEDVWWIHRKWSWVLYNGMLSEEDLIVKSEPYRQEALRSFEALAKKDGNTEEGRAAKQELELLKKYQDDGKLYGIINEAGAEGIKAFR